MNNKTSSRLPVFHILTVEVQLNKIHIPTEQIRDSNNQIFQVPDKQVHNQTVPTPK
ncbi:hypothetical protein RchiOBHm_Chr1g0321771 [Rosa chinensis]|uniref:Uncharacterized protein n=1 Tax=Rosa chinensis TaxID=74649 RepID=A0A2P6S8Z6_ROSCH|nr:hypothetical protein RchiOBHm_Chr1g0321771 [Rosa chinensis]